MYICYDTVDLFKMISTPSLSTWFAHSLFPPFRLGADSLFRAVVDNVFPQLLCFYVVSFVVYSLD